MRFSYYFFIWIYKYINFHEVMYESALSLYFTISTISTSKLKFLIKLKKKNFIKRLVLNFYFKPCS